MNCIGLIEAYHKSLIYESVMIRIYLSHLPVAQFYMAIMDIPERIIYVFFLALFNFEYKIVDT